MSESTSDLASLSNASGMVDLGIRSQYQATKGIRSVPSLLPGRDQGKWRGPRKFGQELNAHNEIGITVLYRGSKRLPIGEAGFVGEERPVESG